MIISQKFLNKLENKARKLGLRERILLTILVLGFIYVIWQRVVMYNLEVSNKRLLVSEKRVQQEIVLLQEQLKDIQKKVDKRKVDILTTRIGSLKNINKALESEIVNLTKNLIPPDEMLKLLQDILEEGDTVKVLNLKNLMETQFFSSRADVEEAGEEVKLEIYKHGIEIDVEATYFGIMEFLYKLEKLKWNLIWDSFQYEVVEYPQSRVKFVIYTLSLSDNWIGL